MTDFERSAMEPEAKAGCVVESPVPRLPELDRPTKPELTAQGWERRFMADSERLAEYVEQYAALGYEVHVEKVSPEEIGPECEGCRLIMCRQFVTLYTRRRSA